MDPCTAFSLACGVIQIVDFSAKAVVMCKEVHAYGSLLKNQDLEEITKHLIDLQNDLSLPSNAQNLGSSQLPDDRGLEELAEKCSMTAQKLIMKLQALKVEGQHKRRQAIKKILKAFWEKGEIEDIQKRLDGYQRTLNTRILVNLRLVKDGYCCVSRAIGQVANDMNTKPCG